MKKQINYRGINIEIEGEYYKGSYSLRYDSPPEPSDFEIEKIFYKDTDVTELFELIDDWNNISNQVIEEIEG